MKQATRNVRHKARVALLLVGMINHFEFPDGKSILHRDLAIAPSLARHSRCRPAARGTCTDAAFADPAAVTAVRATVSTATSRPAGSGRAAVVRTHLHPCSSVNRLNRAGP
jgi:hypothetical protein